MGIVVKPRRPETLAPFASFLRLSLTLTRPPSVPPPFSPPPHRCATRARVSTNASERDHPPRRPTSTHTGVRRSFIVKDTCLRRCQTSSRATAPCAATTSCGGCALPTCGSCSPDEPPPAPARRSWAYHTPSRGSSTASGAPRKGPDAVIHNHDACMPGAYATRRWTATCVTRVGGEGPVCGARHNAAVSAHAGAHDVSARGAPRAWGRSSLAATRRGAGERWARRRGGQARERTLVRVGGGDCSVVGERRLRQARWGDRQSRGWARGAGHDGAGVTMAVPEGGVRGARRSWRRWGWAARSP